MRVQTHGLVGFNEGAISSLIMTLAALLPGLC